MRILFVNYEYPPLGGGGGNATREMARGLAARGHAVAVMTTRFRGQPREEVEQGVRMLRVRAPRRRRDRCRPWEMAGFMAAAPLAGLRRARQFRPDIIPAFFAMPSGPPAWWFSRRLKVPYMLCVQGGDVPRPFKDELALLHGIARPVLRMLWRGAAAVVANSEGLRRMALQFESRPPTLMIPNGVDAARFHPAPNGVAGPGDGGEVILFSAARLSVEKEFGRLFGALAGLPGGLPPWRLRIAGDGPERVKLESLLDRLGLRERVELLGWRDKEAMPELYRQSDVFVFLSRGEGSPNAVVEAQASGLPVIGARVRGVDELIEPERDGLLFDYGDDAALAEAMARLIRDRDLRQRMGAAARRRAENFSWESVVQQFEELCAKILRGEKPTD